jgi:hypothetical protein
MKTETRKRAGKVGQECTYVFEKYYYNLVVNMFMYKHILTFMTLKFFLTYQLYLQYGCQKYPPKK